MATFPIYASLPKESAHSPTELVVNLAQDDLIRLKASAVSQPGTSSTSHSDGSVINSSSGHNTSTSGLPSDDEDYDGFSVSRSSTLRENEPAILQQQAKPSTSLQSHSPPDSVSAIDTSDGVHTPPSMDERKPPRRRRSIPLKLQRTGSKGKYILSADDPEIREILRRGVQRETEGQTKKKRSRFSDLVFTRRFTTFDRQNPNHASAPFHGFFTLFWLSTFLLLVKVAANNWKAYGSVFGPNQILAMMFHRDVIVLGLTDGVLCGSTVFCLILQKVILRGWLNWNRSGWIIQHVGNSFSQRIDVLFRSLSNVYVTVISMQMITRIVLAKILDFELLPDQPNTLRTMPCRH